MGVLDDLSNTFTKGTAAVERNARILVLKTRIGEAQTRRNNATAVLGAQLYQQFMHNPEVRAGHEQLFDNVAACDAEIADLQTQVKILEDEAAVVASAQPEKTCAQPAFCPSCGSALPLGAHFCHTCGAPVTSAPQPATTPVADTSANVTPTETSPVEVPIAQDAPEPVQATVIEDAHQVYEVPLDQSPDHFYVESKPQNTNRTSVVEPVHPAEVKPLDQ